MKELNLVPKTIVVVGSFDMGDEIRFQDKFVLAEDYVLEGNLAKFTQNPGLQKMLLDTGNKVLVEASPYDTICGIGLSEEDARNGVTWRGQNLLGNMLIEVRSQIIADPYLLFE
jgi:ribA/ribD-fused uncharacterized protein